MSTASPVCNCVLRARIPLLLLSVAVAPLWTLRGVEVAGARDNPRRLTSVESKRVEEFGRLAAQLAQKRQQGEEETEKLQEQALSILDGAAVEALDSDSNAKLDALNEQLARFVSHTAPVGEDYRILALDPASSVFALVANLGVGGPSAVRIYSRAGATGHYQLAARIDRYTQKDFFDEYLELIPAGPSAMVFVTVSGRTDELQTGSFSAWQFDGRAVRLLWASDLLLRSSYENRPDGFLLAYCDGAVEEKPRECRQMAQDRYQWDGAAWRRIEHKPVAAPSR